MNIPRVKLKAIRRKNSTAYQLNYRLNGKRIREIVAHNKKDAEIFLAERQHELTFGIHGIRPMNSKIISLKELLSNYLSSKKGTIRPSSYDRYVNYFTVFERFMYKYFTDACSDISRITSRYLQECFMKLSTEEVTNSKSWQPSTINILRDLLAEIFNSAVTDKYITENPVNSTRPLDVPQKDTLRFYSKEQCKEIVNNLDAQWIPFINFLSATGLRKGEIINLTWNNVSLDQNNPFVRIPVTKGGRVQTIRLTTKAIGILKAQKGKSKTYVFPNKNGGILRKAAPNEALKKALDKVGIKGTIHMFRHTFASNFLMDGVGSLNDLSNYLSHADTETTKIYAHLSAEYQVDIVKRLEKSQESKVQEE
jgi:integrase